MKLNINLPKSVKELVDKIQLIGGTSFLVGGSVRDALLGIDIITDWDIEVFHITEDQLRSIIGNKESVGKSHEVFNMFTKDGIEIDFSFPRSEVSTGDKHTDIETEPNPWMSFEEAASRRDFTVNAMMLNLSTMELLDFFDGKKHLSEKVLVPVSEKFKDDVFRPVRGGRFISQLGFEASDDLIDWSFKLKPKMTSLPFERWTKEIKKVLLRSDNPSLFFKFLNDIGWISLFKELEDLISVEQNPKYHPEGDVWNHTMFVLDSAANISRREKLSDVDKLVLLLSALLHDVGKPNTTVFKNGRWTSPGHDKEGVIVAEKFFEKLPDIGTEIKKRVLELIELHMVDKSDKITPKMVRKLLGKRLKHNSLDMLIFMMEADNSGRPPLKGGLTENAKKILELSKSLDVVNKTDQLVLGRDLIKLGWKAGPEMGKKLKELYEIQLDEGLDKEQLLSRL